MIAGAIGYWAFDNAVLWATFHAFGVSPPLTVILMGYLIGQLGGAAADPRRDRRHRPRADRDADRLRSPRGGHRGGRARLPDHPLLAAAGRRRRRLRAAAPRHAERPGVRRLRAGDRRAVRRLPASAASHYLRRARRGPWSERAGRSHMRESSAAGWEKLRRSCVQCAVALIAARRSRPRLRPRSGLRRRVLRPADQPPFGGETTTLSEVASLRARGFRASELTPGQATAIATEALTPRGSVRRFETRTRTGAGLPRAVAGRLLRWGGQRRRAGGDRRRRGVRAGEVDRHAGRHQARPRLPGRRLGQGEQLVDLAAALRALHGAVRRSAPAAAPDPPRPAGAARLQRLARLLQPRQDRGVGRAGLSGARLRLPADAGRRVQAGREPRPAAARWRRGAGWWPASSRWSPSTPPTSRPRAR